MARHADTPGEAIRAAIGEAVACYRAGAYDRAAALYQWVLARAPSAAHYADLGVILRKLGNHRQAVACLQNAVSLEPASADYRFKLGEACFNAGLIDEARRAWQQVLEREPRHADALSWLGCLDMEAGRLDDAGARFRESIAANPGHYHAHDNLGIALRKAGEPAQAIAWHRRAIALQPGLPQAHDHLGTTLSELGRIEEAMACHRRAIAANPSYAAAHCNLATAQVTALRLDEAAASYRRALELDPDNASFHWNYSNALLLAGRFDEGWREYEWRWRAPELKKRKPAYPAPEWRGEPVTGRTVLLYAEQGYGDVIQFVRYAGLLADRGARVLLLPQPELARLLATAPSVAHVVDSGKPPPLFDFHASILSLPYRFGTRLETIPASVPYLHADRAQAEAWRARMGSAPGLRVGLIWGGRRTHRFDHARSCALSEFAPLGRVAGIRFFSLQKGEQAAQTHSPPAGMALTDWTSELGDFADTAALIDNLDLVISVDTAGAHLAGALGKPVWLLNRYQTEWRWLLEREDSPWYPTMRLFRQPRPGDWGNVMDRVAAELEKLARQS